MVLAKLEVRGLVRKRQMGYEITATEAEVENEVLAKLVDEFPEDGSAIKNAYRSLYKKLVRKRVLEEGVRLDGRKVDEVRPFWIQAGIIPRVHGSGLFTRGETQGLSITTLGMQRMEQMIDDLSPNDSKRYMHNYNFPPYSTGEAGLMRGPKRREIGHGALSEKRSCRQSQLVGSSPTRSGSFPRS